MGSSESKESETNSGVLSSVINHIDSGVDRLELLQEIAIVLKCIIILVILLKWLVKYIKNEQNRIRQMEEIALRRS